MCTLISAKDMLSMKSDSKMDHLYRRDVLRWRSQRELSNLDWSQEERCMLNN